MTFLRPRLAAVPALVLAMLLSGCQGEARDPVPHGLAQREDPDLSQIPVGGAVGPVQLVTQWPGFSFSSPVGVHTAPGERDRLFVMEQAGVVWSVTTGGGAAARARFLDLTARIQSGGEEGLLGLAFAPDFASNGQLYVHSSRVGPRRSVLSRLTANAGRTLVDPDTELVILEVDQPYANHNGGTILFGNDGMLYWALGDGGSGGDPHGHGQRLDSHLGKVLRLDVSQARPGAPYQVPADNPFATTGGARPEIWALGLRNPWRMSLDRTTGELWAGDVGQGEREEIDVIVRGGNYGWNFREGSQAFRSGGPTGLIEPVFDYPRAEGYCVTGGHVYRGTRLPGLVGRYVYGDYGSGRIWALRRRSAGTVDQQLLVDSRKAISSFGEDQDGELVVCSHGDGQIYRLAPGGGGSAPTMPATLSATRLFADVQAHLPARGVVPYDVHAPLWSDGADKERFLALPAGARLGYRAGDAWQVPAGAVFVKTFSLLQRDGDPASRRRLETRILVHGVDRVDGWSYQWRDDQTDADLLADGARIAYPLRDAGGNARTHTHVFPSRPECLSCHTEAAGRVLGIKTAQLNRELAYPSGIRDHQLRALSHVGLVTGVPADLGALPRLTASDDQSASVEQRARSWLDVNCSHCHRPGAVGNATIDLRADTDLAATGLLDQLPRLGDLGVAGARLVLPGDATRSILWLRATRRDASAMPPLASLLVDPAAMVLLRTWIEQLPR